MVKDKMIISDGYNGTPSGFENVCEENDVTKPYVLHAEANAITKLARSSNNSDGSTLYVTASPCDRMCQAHHPGGHQACGVMQRNTDSTKASNSWRELASRWNISIQMKEISTISKHE